MTTCAPLEKKNNEILCRARSCATSLNSNTPAIQYQRQKIIQNTVRVAASLYTMNLGALNAYTRPELPTRVNWNQMSDRPVPSVQKTYVPTNGSLMGSSSTRHTVTASKPGAQSPGGKGCDIKHNSYDRYLNRIKGKAPLRRGVIPPGYGLPIPFNRALPVYGGKTTKTNIVNHCNCPLDSTDVRAYENRAYYPWPEVQCGYSLGQYVYAKENQIYFVRALIIQVLEDNSYEVQFDDGNTATKKCVELRPYFPCDCPQNVDPNSVYEVQIGNDIYGFTCATPVQ